MQEKPLPAHAKIEQHLRKLILAGEGRAEPLPTEAALAAQFKVNRMTVRQAYQRLAAEGLVSRRRGHGSYVNPPIAETLPLYGNDSFSTWIDDREQMTRHVLKYELRPCPPLVAALFRQDAGAMTTYLERMRFIRGIPFFDVRYMPADIFAKVSVEDIEKGSLLLRLLSVGFNPTSVRVDVDAHLASDADSAALGIPVGDPVLERRITYVDATGNALFFGRTRCSGQRGAYSFFTDLTGELKERLASVRTVHGA